MSQSYRIHSLVSDVPTLAKFTNFAFHGSGNFVIDPNQTLWIYNKGNNFYEPHIAHYDLNGHQLGDNLYFADIRSELELRNLIASLRMITISNLLWLRKNVVWSDQGQLLSIPPIYPTAPLLGTIDQQPTVDEIALIDFYHDYLGPSNDIGLLVNWMINHPYDENNLVDLYLWGASFYYSQLLLDLHNANLISEYAYYLVQAQNAISDQSSQNANPTDLTDLIGQSKSITNTLQSSPIQLPIGLVYNETDGFVRYYRLSAGLIPRIVTDYIDSCDLIVATSAGHIYTHHPLISAYHMVLNIDDSNSHAVYTGATIVANQLYLTDLGNQYIRVYDYRWDNVRELNLNGFKDPDLPTNYSPFNIQAINGLIYVVYAQLDMTDPINHPNVMSKSNSGLVNLFDPQGHLIQRLITDQHLNAPWSLILHEDQFFISNLGNDHILIYDQQWHYLGHVNLNGYDSLAIKTHDHDRVCNLRAMLSTKDKIYFVSQPEKAHGLLGYFN